MNQYLRHHGIKGQKWGVRRFQNEDGSLTAAGRKRYDADNKETIKTNKDGSKTIPTNYKFNRVGGAKLDINKTGALYVSSGKDDVSRYMQMLGPNPVAKLLGNYSTHVQHISVKENLRMPSDKENNRLTAEALLKDDGLFNSFKNNGFSKSATKDGSPLTKDFVKKAFDNPGSDDATRLAFAVSCIYGDPRDAATTNKFYKHFRDNGYDVLPDLHDTLEASSKTAMIVINPKKLEVSETMLITKEMMKEAKQWVKSLEELPYSSIIEQE